ncbi:hypothetical protein ACFXP3_21460, partial [Streptomyces sp. NPDC059096]
REERRPQSLPGAGGPPPGRAAAAPADGPRPGTAPRAPRRGGGAPAAATATQRQLGALRERDGGHLAEARVAATGPTARGRFGMCGRLDVYPGI